MDMNHSSDYHDYVFKDGRRVCRFDDMYRNSSEIPWHQDKTAYYVFSEIDIAVLKQFEYRTVCEIGCGLGYFSERLRNELAGPGGCRPDVTGVDISATAVEQAGLSFPGIRFTEGNLLRSRPLAREWFDLVVVKEVLWYVCKDLHGFLNNAVDMAGEGGFLYVSQSFPESSTWIGQDVIDGPGQLKEHLLKYTSPVHMCIEWDWSHNGRPLVHYLGRKK